LVTGVAVRGSLTALGKAGEIKLPFFEQHLGRITVTRADVVFAYCALGKASTNHSAWDQVLLMLTPHSILRLTALLILFLDGCVGDTKAQKTMQHSPQGKHAPKKPP
jgi:hypothetical protein